MHEHFADTFSGLNFGTADRVCFIIGPISPVGPVSPPAPAPAPEAPAPEEGPTTFGGKLGAPAPFLERLKHTLTDFVDHMTPSPGEVLEGSKDAWHAATD